MSLHLNSTYQEVESPQLLTARQLAIVDLIAQNCSFAQIGQRLGILPQTVEFHARRIQEILGFHPQSSKLAD